MYQIIIGVQKALPSDSQVGSSKQENRPSCRHQRNNQPSTPIDLTPDGLGTAGITPVESLGFDLVEQGSSPRSSSKDTTRPNSNASSSLGGEDEEVGVGGENIPR